MNTEELRKEAAEKYAGKEYQPLFDHMSQEHGLTLLQSEMDEIRNICRDMDKGAEWEAEKSKWIEVKTKEDLPKDNKDYWAVDKNGKVIVKHGFSILIHNTTHYQLILKPAPPKTSKQ